MASTEEFLIHNILPQLPEHGTVARLILSRREMGMKKYGQSVDDAGLTLREWLQHVLEEQLDAAIYYQKACELDRDWSGTWSYAARRCLYAACVLQRRINDLDGCCVSSGVPIELYRPHQ